MFAVPEAMIAGDDDNGIVQLSQGFDSSNDFSQALIPSHQHFLALMNGFFARNCFFTERRQLANLSH